MVIPTTTPTAKVKYINNKELLKEIHESKKSFCSYLEPQYANFDAIVHNIEDITPELIDSIREKKSKPRGKPSTEMEPREDIVIRLMTYTHIPLDPFRVRKSRVTDQSYARTSFVPFKHYILTDEGLKEVCRSHWVGGFENGHFVADGGKINNRLASMFMLLVERYSRRTNWRSYCIDAETEALTQRGWLKGNEINEDDIILSYEDGDLKWSKIKSIYRNQNYDGKMFKITGVGIDALVTPGHKFVTESGIKKVEYLNKGDQVILSGNFIDDTYWFEYSTIPVKSLDFQDGGKKSGSMDDPNQPTVDYKGLVWCPETEFGSFMARRNKSIYISGNSYNEEFRGQALLQLSQIGLQFDESKSDNPFAFYTTAVKNSFTRVFNLEKKSQNIRDDLLIIAGVQPSYTRQGDHMDLERQLGDTTQKKRAAPKKIVEKKISPIVEDDLEETGTI